MAILSKKNIEEMGGVSVYEKYEYNGNGEPFLVKKSECYDEL